MRARGWGLKKDTHPVTASNPGETPASPEVSGKKKLGITRNLFLLHCKEDTAFCEGVKGKSTKTCCWVFLRRQGHPRKLEKSWSGDLSMLLSQRKWSAHLTAWGLRPICSYFLPENTFRKHLWLRFRLVWMHYRNLESFHEVASCAKVEISAWNHWFAGRVTEEQCWQFSCSVLED